MFTLSNKKIYTLSFTWTCVLLAYQIEISLLYIFTYRVGFAAEQIARWVGERTDIQVKRHVSLTPIFLFRVCTGLKSTVKPVLSKRSRDNPKLPA